MFARITTLFVLLSCASWAMAQSRPATPPPPPSQTATPTAPPPSGAPAPSSTTATPPTTIGPPTPITTKAAGETPGVPQTQYSGHNSARDNSRNDTWDDAAGESERAKYAVHSGTGSHPLRAAQPRILQTRLRRRATQVHRKIPPRQRRRRALSNDSWQRAPRQPSADRSGDRSTSGSVSCGNRAEREHASAVV